MNILDEHPGAYLFVHNIHFFFLEIKSWNLSCWTHRCSVFWVIAGSRLESITLNSQSRVLYNELQINNGMKFIL